MRKGPIAALLVLACSIAVAQQVMDNDSVIKLVKAGLSDDLIITTINASPGKYDTSADGLIALKGGGASDKVVSAIIAKASSPASAPSAGTPALPGSEAPDSAPPAKAPVVSAQEPSEPEDAGTSTGSAPIPAHSRVVIAPMGGFETYFAAAVREKRVPITLTLDRASAQFFVVSTNTEWRGFVYGSGASWTSTGGAAGSSASSTRGLEASIMIIDAKSKDVIWAYEVHKSSHGSLLFGTLGARGQQSIAEACAKHLREYIEKGR
jgi:hypothetical protein